MRYLTIRTWLNASKNGTRVLKCGWDRETISAWCDLTHTNQLNPIYIGRIDRLLDTCSMHEGNIGHKLEFLLYAHVHHIVHYYYSMKAKKREYVRYMLPPPPPPSSSSSKNELSSTSCGTTYTYTYIAMVASIAFWYVIGRTAEPSSSSSSTFTICHKPHYLWINRTKNQSSCIAYNTKHCVHPNNVRPNSVNMKQMLRRIQNTNETRCGTDFKKRKNWIFCSFVCLIAARPYRCKFISVFHS